MVKICPKCKNVMPTQAVRCTKCGYTNLVLICPKCKKILPIGTKSCPICEDSISELTQNQSKVSYHSGLLKKIVITFSIVIIISIIFIAGFKIIPNFISKQNQELDGYDKIAFDALILNVNIFKDPTSVRVLGGYVEIEDDPDRIQYGDVVWLKVIAANSFGATTTGYYFFRSKIEYYTEFEDLSKDSHIYIKCNSDNMLDVGKINKALNEYWGNLEQ